MSDLKFEPGTVLCEKGGWQVECLSDGHDQPFRILKKQKDGRYCTNYVTLYLFSDPEHDDGNAVIVAARSAGDAMEMANRFCVGFDPVEVEVVAATDAENQRTVGLNPVVITANSYYRPDLCFEDMDDFSHLSERQVAVLRKKLDEQHPTTIPAKGNEDV